MFLVMQEFEPRIMTSFKYSSFENFRKESELTQLTEGNSPRIDANGLL
jgi:hypothetical protein